MQRPKDVTSWIDKRSTLATSIDYIGKSNHFSTQLFIDVQAYNGSVSVLSVYIAPFFQSVQRRLLLIDVLALGENVFSTPGKRSGRTLKDILESSTISKGFFDVRGDAHVLHRHYGIRLAGVKDLQLMAFFHYRSEDTKALDSFVDCVRLFGLVRKEERDDFNKIVKRREELVALEGAEAQKMFNQRPLSADAIEYCQLDVKLLPLMCSCFGRDFMPDQMVHVLEASRSWVEQGQAPDFTGQGEHMAQVPPVQNWWAPASSSVMEKYLGYS